MKKSLLALAALGAFASGAMAQSSSVTIYGIVDLGVVYQNRAEAADTSGIALGGVGQTSKLAVAQGARSRLGFKGVEDLGGGYQAKFKLEHRLSPDTGAQTSTVFWDMSVVSLVTPIGEFGAGRDYMPAFYLQYLQDPWINQGVAEVGGTSYAFANYNFKGLTAPGAARGARIDNALFYSMQANGFTVQLAASLKEDGTQAAGANNRYGFGLQYAAGPLFVGLAYDQSEEVDGTKQNLLMVGAAYDFGVIKPRLTYARTDKDTITPSTITLAATAPLGAGFVKAGYAHLDYDDAASHTANKLSLGYEYALSKRTALYTDVTNGKVKTFKSVTAVDFGIRHLF